MAKKDVVSELYSAFNEYNALREKYSDEKLTAMMGEEYEDLKARLEESLYGFFDEFLAVHLASCPYADECIKDINRMLDVKLYRDIMSAAILIDLDIDKALNTVGEAFQDAVAVCQPKFMEHVELKGDRYVNTELNLEWDSKVGRWLDPDEDRGYECPWFNPMPDAKEERKEETEER